MRTVAYESKLYRLETDRFGFMYLTRKADDAEAFFQSADDTQVWNDNLTALDQIDQRKGWAAGNSYDSCFNVICDSYDDVLTRQPNAESA